MTRTHLTEPHVRHGGNVSDFESGIVDFSRFALQKCEYKPDWGFFSPVRKNLFCFGSFLGALEAFATFVFVFGFAIFAFVFVLVFVVLVFGGIYIRLFFGVDLIISFAKCLLVKEAD